MPFAIGDRVHVPNFGTGTVREVRNGRRYVVELKERAMVVAESDMTLAEPRERRGPAASPPAIPAGLERQHAPASIDLHGMTTDEAIAALDEFLDGAIRASHAEVRIIHGRSGGRLKSAVHARLRTIPSVRSFRVDHANPGVTIVGL